MDDLPRVDRVTIEVVCDSGRHSVPPVLDELQRVTLSNRHGTASAWIGAGHGAAFLGADDNPIADDFEALEHLVGVRRRIAIECDDEACARQNGQRFRLQGRLENMTGVLDRLAEAGVSRIGVRRLDRLVREHRGVSS